MKKYVRSLGISVFLMLGLVQPAPSQGANLLIQLKVVKASTNSVTLSWSVLFPVPVKSFEVHRSAVTPEFTLLATTAGPQPTYTDSTLQPGVVNSYKVRAVLNQPGPTVYSEFSPPVQAVTIPGAPVLSCSERTADTNMTQLSWAAVPGATGYEVEQSTFQRSQFGPYELLAETTTPGYLKSGMADIIDYKFRVRAYALLNGKKLFGEYSNFVVAKHVPVDSSNGRIGRQS
jgi:hypothetical protein